MKRLLRVCLVLALFFALLPGAGAEEGFRFTRENFPKLDGSTSMVPLGQGIASVLLGESREDAAGLIAFNRTTQSFRNLCEGYSDLVIAAEPKEDVFREMAEAKFPYLMEQIAKEALVFVVNENNPVTSLTSDQVRQIYTGEITNWKQVGGEDLPIAAFQRNPTAGSQVMMEKLVMAGQPMMEAPAAMVPGGMGELIEAVRSYDNSANAIGYTVFYYAADMQMAQGLKILKIDGVAPSAETLRSEAYPFINGYYACVWAQAPADSPQRRLYDWLVSQAGQDLLTLEGYVSVYGPGEAPTDGADILTDYTSYTPNGGTPAKFTDFDCPHDHLEPNSGYGKIYPYQGALLYGTWEDESWDYRAGSLMGFFNQQGQRITDPIYSSIFPLGMDPTEKLFWVVSDGEERYGLVAQDGSLATPICYNSVYRLGAYIFAATDYDNRVFQLLDRNLTPVADQDDFTFDGRCYLPYEYRNGLTLCQWVDEDWNVESVVLDGSRNILLTTPGYLSIDDNSVLSVYDSDGNVTLYGPDMAPLELPEVGNNRSTIRLGSRFYMVSGDDGKCVIDKYGSAFLWDLDSAFSTWGDWFSVTKNGKTDVYDPDGHLVYSGIDPDWSFQGDGIFVENTGDEIVLHKLPEDKTLSFTNGSYCYPVGEVIVVFVEEGDGWVCRGVDRELNLLPQSYSDLSYFTDWVTGEGYLIARDSNGFAGEQRLLATDGRTQLFRANGELQIQDGYFTVSSDWAFSCYDPQGNLIFCYPYYGMAAGD